jgi:hypothetical protein
MALQGKKRYMNVSRHQISKINELWIKNQAFWLINTVHAILRLAVSCKDSKSLQKAMLCAILYFNIPIVSVRTA